MLKKIKIVFILSILILSSCTENKPPEQSEIIHQTDIKETGEDNNQNEFNQSIIIYTEGKVTIYSKGAWIDGKIGDEIFENDVIETGEESYCEIQFGDKTILKILDNTTISIGELVTDRDKLKVEGNLKNGTILAKLKKLTNMEKFRIKTDQVVAGVRGTEFFVSTISGRTSVTVDKGSVAVYPNDEKILNLEETISQIEDEELQQELMKTIPVIEKGESLSLTSDEIEEVIPDIKESFTELIVILEDETTTIDEIKEEIKTAVEKIEKTTTELDNKKAPITEEEKEIFKHIENSNFIENVESKEELYGVSIEVEPTDSVVFVNNSMVSIGNYQRLYAESEIAVRVERNGYITSEKTISTSDPESRNYKVILEKEEIPDIKMILTTEPENAVITINDEQFSMGEITIKPADKYEIRIEADGYETYDETLFSIEADYNNYIKLEKKLLINNSKLSTVSFIRKPTVYKKNWIIADQNGVIYSIDKHGNKNWSVKTDNKPNQNSYPVIKNNLIIFSGGTSLYLINADSGNVINRKELNSNSSHIFGRTVHPVSEGILFPQNNSLQLLSYSELSVINELELPDISSSSPVEIDNNWYITSSKGTLYKISKDTMEITGEISSGIGQMVASAPVKISDNLIMVIDRKGSAAAIDMNNNSVNWSNDYSDYGGNIYTNPISDSISAYILSEGNIISVSSIDGALKNRFEGATALPLIYKDRLIWIKNNILTVNRGEVVTKEIRVTESTTQPSVIDNYVLISGKDGTITILNMDKVIE